jgi:uncharacterized membrane protein
MFDFLSFLMAIVALIVTVKAFNQIAALRARLEALEEMPAQTRPAPPPLPEQALPNRAPGIAAEMPTPATEAESAAPIASDPDAAREDTTGNPPMPPPSPQPVAAASFEERVGTRWVVWVGGLTLALGGFFMVRYSIEAGLVGPEVPVLLGGAFALALLMAGEWMRRKDSILSIDVLPIANIPAILTAAGTSVAFATVYAAYALYGFLAPATAFILLGLVALGTLAAALLHGPALAGLGVAAGFVTPILVSSDEPDFWALYVYLTIVTAAALALARIRLWRWLAVTTIVFAVLWTLPCLRCGPIMVAPHLFHIAAGFILAAMLMVCGLLFGPPAEEGRIEPISSGSLAAYLLGATAIVLASFQADAAMIVFAVLVAGTLAIAWRAPAATAAIGAAALLVFIVFAEWTVRANPDMLVLPGGALPGMGPNATDGSVYGNTIAAGALILALTYLTLEIRRIYHGPFLDNGATGRRRAIYLFDRLPGVRRGAAWTRLPVQLAARPARFGAGDRADDRQSVPDRHVDAHGCLPRAVVHVPRAGAGSDRLAVPADPVSQAGCAAIGSKLKAKGHRFA